MAHGDQVRGLLGGHDPGEAGDLQGITLWVAGKGLEDDPRKLHKSTGLSFPFRGLFGGNVHHGGAASAVVVGEFRHGTEWLSYIGEKEVEGTL